MSLESALLDALLSRTDPRVEVELRYRCSREDWERALLYVVEQESARWQQVGRFSLVMDHWISPDPVLDPVRIRTWMVEVDGDSPEEKEREEEPNRRRVTKAHSSTRNLRIQREAIRKRRLHSTQLGAGLRIVSALEDPVHLGDQTVHEPLRRAQAAVRSVFLSTRTHARWRMEFKRVFEGSTRSQIDECIRTGQPCSFHSIEIEFVSGETAHLHEEVRDLCGWIKRHLLVAEDRGAAAAQG
jgi:hypothetical protein